MSNITPLEELKLLREKLLKEKTESKKIVRICATGCRAKGADSIVRKFRELAEAKGCSCNVGVGSDSESVRNVINAAPTQEGNPYAIEIRETGCHGFCAAAPVVVIEPEGIFYPSVKEEDVEDILEKTVIRGEVINSLLWKDPTTGKRVKSEKNIPFYKNQTKFILDLCGKIDPQEIRDYILNDGYSALAKVLTSMTDEDVIEAIRAAKLRGRGGAGFPTGLKWELTRKANGDKKYIICNADEGDPGAFMDRALLEGNPHAIIEGMLIAAYAIGANDGYIYVRAEYPIAIKHLKLALKQAKELKLLGENILNIGFNLNIILKEGAGAFVCGEETALIASIEGKRGMPRPRPPFPAQSGLWNKPTCINNVETLANIPKIILNGAEKYKALGTEKSGGTKIFSLAGKVKNSGLVEVPIGTPLKKLVFDIGGGIPDGRKFKAIQTGGPSGGCIPAKYLDTPIDYETLTQLGSIMGSGGMIVLDDNTCMVDIAHYFLSFTQTESCGKCVPCRIGTKRMLEILTRIKEGKGEEDDLDKLIELAEIIKDSALCGLGQTAPNPVLTTIKYFRDEYEAHIKEKRCPAGTCRELIEYYIDENLCKGCGVCKKNCPQDAIIGDKKKAHVIDQDKCIKCGICLNSCKFDAIVVR